MCDSSPPDIGSQDSVDLRGWHHLCERGGLAKGEELCCVLLSNVHKPKGQAVKRLKVAHVVHDHNGHLLTAQISSLWVRYLGFFLGGGRNGDGDREAPNQDSRRKRGEGEGDRTATDTQTHTDTQTNTDTQT